MSSQIKSGLKVYDDVRVLVYARKNIFQASRQLPILSRHWNLYTLQSWRNSISKSSPGCKLWLFLYKLNFKPNLDVELCLPPELKKKIDPEFGNISSPLVRKKVTDEITAPDLRWWESRRRSGKIEMIYMYIYFWRKMHTVGQNFNNNQTASWLHSMFLKFVRYKYPLPPPLPNWDCPVL